MAECTEFVIERAGWGQRLHADGGKHLERDERLLQPVGHRFQHSHRH